MSLISTISRFVRSPQGRQMAQRAMSYARSPEGRARVDQARRQLAARRGGRNRIR